MNNRNRNLLIGGILVVLLIILMVAGIMFYKFYNPSYTNPSSLDELKKAKELGKSEYYKCLDEAQDRSCEIELLRQKGYTDNVDCIMDNENPVCGTNCDWEILGVDYCNNLQGRYNAEVDASNECLKLHPEKPSIIDCINLIGK